MFSKARGPELARRLRSGMTAVNGVISFAAIPSLPFGGVGDSGFGRIHGEDGLKEFTYAKSVARQRFKPALALTTFARTAKTDTTLATIVAALHGGASQLPKLPRSARRAPERDPDAREGLTGDPVSPSRRACSGQSSSDSRHWGVIESGS